MAQTHTGSNGAVNRFQKMQNVSIRTVQEYLAMALRGKWTIFFTFIVVFGIVAFYTRTADRVYRATSSVRIDIKQYQASLWREPMAMNTTVNVIQNELEVLKSYTLAESVARKLIEVGYIDSQKTIPVQIIAASNDGASRGGLASVDEISDRVQSAVDFEPVRESEVIKVMAKSKSPEEAALIANTYAAAYHDRNVYASRTKSRTFRQFLETQVKDKQSSLQKSEEELRRYMEAKGVVSLDDNQRKVLEQLSSLQAQHDEAEINIQALEKTLTSYRDQAAQQEQSVAKVMGEANDPYIRLLQEQLSQLEVQRDITVAQNPDFVGKEAYNARLTEIDGQIEALKAKLKKRTDDFLVNLLPASGGGEQRDPAGYLKQVKQRMLESQIQLQALQARKKALAQSIADYNRQFENLPKKTMDFARLQREKMSLEKLYLTIEEKYNEANISEQGELGYVDIFDPAVVPANPSSPKVGLNLLLGALAGLGLGFILVFVREYMREVIRTPEDLKKLGLTPLSTVLDMSDEIKRSQNGKAERRSVAPQIVMVTNPMSPIAESYRHLRTSIHLAHRDQAPRTILVTSPNPGEGKTTTVGNLAVAFARSGRKVLLVDADMRRPSIHTVLGLRAKPGLSELLSGEAVFSAVLQTLDVHDLHVITSGTPPSNPAEFLGSDTMIKVVQQMQDRYDVVLFDCPPLLAVTDASVLSTIVDRVVLVISSGSTAVDALERTMEMLEGVGAKPAGIVLNNFNLKQAYGVRYKTAGYGYYGYAYHRTDGKDNGKVKVRAPY